MLDFCGEQSEQRKQSEQPEQRKQSEQPEQYEQSEQSEQSEQYKQPEQCKQSQQPTQSEQSEQRKQCLRLVKDCLAASSEPHLSTDARFPFSPYIHVFILHLVTFVIESNKHGVRHTAPLVFIPGIDLFRRLQSL